MDDSLEQPDALPDPISLTDTSNDNGENSSGDEDDGGLDWTKIPYAQFR